VLMGCPVQEEPVGDRVYLLGMCCREAGGHGADVAGQRTEADGGAEAGTFAFTPGCPPKDEAIIRALAGLCGFDGRAVLELAEAERSRLWGSTAELLSR